MRRIVKLASLFMFVSPSCFAIEPYWIHKANMPTLRDRLGVVSLNDKIYAMGGLVGTSASFKTVEEYDPVNNVWVAKANMLEARAGMGAAVLNGKIYVFEGNGNTSMEVYDPSSDLWTAKSGGPGGSNRLAAVTVNNKIYAIGGVNSLSSLKVYDDVGDTWIPKRSMHYGRKDFAAAVVNGKIYVMGGTINLVPGLELDKVEEYDPIMDTWSAKSDMLSSRSGFSAVAVNGKIYAIGGGEINKMRVEEYDPALDKWTAKPCDLTWRAEHGGAVVKNRIYVIGGLYHESDVEEGIMGLDASLSIVPPSAVAGQIIRAILSAKYTGTTSATGIFPMLQVNTGSALVSRLSGPSPVGPVNINIGNTQSFTWTYSVTGSGTVTFSSTATGIDATTGGSIMNVASASFVQSSASLVINPSSGRTGQWVSAIFTIVNESSDEMEGVLPFIQVDQGASLVALQNGPVPQSPVNIPPSGSVSFSWTYSVSGAGTVSYRASALSTATGLPYAVIATSEASFAASWSAPWPGNMPVPGKIQIRNNILRLNRPGEFIQIVVRSKGKTGAVDLFLYNRAGNSMGRIGNGPIQLGQDGTGSASFDGKIGGKVLSTGRYWIKASGAVDDKKQILIINDSQ